MTFDEILDQLAVRYSTLPETLGRTLTLRQVQLKYHFLIREKQRESERERAIMNAAILEGLNVALGGKQ